MVEIKVNGLVYVFVNEMPVLDYLDQMADEVRDESYAVAEVRDKA